jgi:hypothetical protein
MARPHRPARGGTYEKRRVSGSPTPAPSAPVDGLSSSDARRLGERIDSTQDRYRVSAIRLIAGRACGLVLVDSVTGENQMVATADDWYRLQAAAGAQRQSATAPATGD